MPIVGNAVYHFADLFECPTNFIHAYACIFSLNSLAKQDPNDADNQSAKLKVLQQMLREHPHIRGVWMDYLCVPQGQKDAQEQDFFQFTLDNIKMLYLSGKVLIFLAIQYMGRFWTHSSRCGGTRLWTRP